MMMMNGTTGPSKQYRRFEKKWLRDATQYTRRKTGVHGKRSYSRKDKHGNDWSL